MTDLIRASSLVNYASLVTELGGTPRKLLHANGVDPSVAGDEDRFIPYTTLAMVVGAAARELDCPDFGLRLSRRQSVDMLGPIAVIARHADTVAEAIDGIAKYIHTYSPAITVGLRRQSAHSEFTFTIMLPRLAHRDLMVELSLGVELGFMRFLIDQDFAPLRVKMQHPRLADPQDYADLFGCPVDFECERNSLVLPNWALSRPIHGRHAAARALAEKYLAPMRPDLAVADHVGELVRRLLPLNQATLVGVAREMAIHPRVLQRRLAEAGTTFEKILDDVRRTTALTLSTEGLQVAQIASALGYSEQSSYTRACRRWFGQSPRQLAGRLRHSAPPGPAVSVDPEYTEPLNASVPVKPENHRRSKPEPPPRDR
ncbi:MAG TPA: AraC family transcriptional regulator [Aldersonia sp.]